MKNKILTITIVAVLFLILNQMIFAIDTHYNELENFNTFMSYENSEKNTYESTITRQINTTKIGLTLFFLVLFTLSLYFPYQQQRKQIKRLKKLLANNIEKNTPDNASQTLQIEDSTIEYVLAGLEEFEIENRFLEQKTSLVNLSKELRTNSS